MLLSSCVAPPASNFSPFYCFLPLGTSNFSQAFSADSQLGGMEYVLWISTASQELPPIPAHPPNVNSLSSFHLTPGTAPHQPAPLHDQDDDADEDGDEEAEAQQQRVFQHNLRRDLRGMAWGQNRTAAQVMLRALGLLGAALCALTLHFPQPLPAVSAATQRRSPRAAVGWIPAWLAVAVFLVIAHLQVPE